MGTAVQPDGWLHMALFTAFAFQAYAELDVWVYRERAHSVSVVSCNKYKDEYRRSLFISMDRQRSG